MLLFMNGVIQTSTNSTTADSSDTPKIIAFPNRGVLLTRQGTLISTNDYEILTAVIQLQNLTFGNQRRDLLCYELLLPVKQPFDEQLSKLRATVEAVFTSERILTTSEILRLVNERKETNTTHIQKRLVAAGAYVMAGAALGTALVSFGLATANTAEISKITAYLEEHEQDILTLQQQILHQIDTTDVIIDTQKETLGIVRQMSINLAKIQNEIQCIHKYIQFTE